MRRAFSIRLAESRDIPAIWNIFRQTSKQAIGIDGVFFTPRVEGEYRHQVAKIVASSHSARPTYWLWVAEAETQEVVGFAGLGYGFPDLLDCYVHIQNPWQKKGVGSSLLQHLLHAGTHELGLQHKTLHALYRDENVATKYFLEKHGFQLAQPIPPTMDLKRVLGGPFVCATRTLL